MDLDLNKYDVEHVCTAHPKMSKQDWDEIYREAWSLYYTPEHMRTLLRRAAATGVSMGSLVKVLVTFATTVRLENVHPLQGWTPPPQAPFRVQARPPARKCVDFLAPPRSGDCLQAYNLDPHDCAAPSV